MHAAHKLVIEAMEASLGSAIARQVRAYADGESFENQNSNAMRRALAWLAMEWVDQMLKQALSEDGYDAVEELAADIEMELEEVGR